MSESTTEPAVRVELSGLFNNNCEWCGEPMTTIHGVMMYDMCFNICPKCNAMFREKMEAKKNKMEAQNEMLKTLYRIGHPGDTRGYKKFLSFLHLGERRGTR